MSKLSDSEAEAAETQVWLAFAVRSEYLNRDTAATLYKEYDEVLSMIVTMIRHPEKWIIDKK